jgi:GDPmannose 4,6-dehydratase
MLRQDGPRDYVVGTGVMHSVRDAVQVAFDAVGLSWRDYVVVDQEFVRPAEVETLCADATRARLELGWESTVKFEELMTMMVESDLAQLKHARKYDYDSELQQTAGW